MVSSSVDFVLCWDRCVSCLSLREKRMETTLTTIRPLADVVLRPTSHPRIISVPFGCNLAFVHREAHLVNCVNSPIQTAPRQRDVGATVNQGQRFGLYLQRQAGGRGHVEEPVTWTPLPHLGLAVCIAGGEVQFCWGPLCPGTSLCRGAGWWKHPRLWWRDRQRTHTCDLSFTSKERVISLKRSLRLEDAFRLCAQNSHTKNSDQIKT